MLIHMGSVSKSTIMVWARSDRFAMNRAAGYPIRMQNTVVRKAILSDVHSTRMKVGSLKKREKLSNVNWKISVRLPPSLVSAYSRIMIIGATMNSPIHRM